MALWATLKREGKRPLCLEFRSSTKLVMFMVATAVFTDVFPYAVIVPILPNALRERAGVSEDKVQMWTSVSLAAFAAAILISAPVWGILADRTNNRRSPMLAGLVLLGCATVLLCFMQNAAMLILGRIFQGMTSSLTWSVGLALVVDTVSSDRIGQAMGWIGVALSMGTLTSPLLGGVVYAQGGYYSVWAMCFAMIAGDIILRLLIVEKKEAAKWLQRTDTVGSQMTQATGTTTYSGKTETNSSDEATLRDVKSLDRNGSFSIAHCEKVVQPQPQHLSSREILSLFRCPRLLAALWGTIAEAVILSSFDGTLPLFVEELFGWDTIGTGLIFLPLVCPTILSPAVGWLCDRYGPRWLSAFGFVWYAPFLVCLRFVSENTLQHKIMLCGLLTGVGIGEAFTFGPLTAEITYAVEEKFPGRRAKPIALAYALYNMAFSVGAMAGPLLGGFLRQSSGWAAVGVCLAIVSIGTSVSCASFVGGAPLWKRRNGQMKMEEKEPPVVVMVVQQQNPASMV